jgi:hypothetical protein
MVGPVQVRGQGPRRPGSGRAWPLRQFPLPSDAQSNQAQSAQASEAPALPQSIEHERPPRRSGPGFWERLAHWFFYRDEPLRQGPAPALGGALMACPRCDSRQPVAASACMNCGMPFICVLELEGAGARRQAGREGWRSVMAVVTLIFVLTNAFLVSGSNAEYEGNTSKLLTSLNPVALLAESQVVELKGPESFRARTELALALLRSRAPDYYSRIQSQVLSIEYMQGRVMKLDDGVNLNLERMGAVSFPAQRRIYVLMDTAFPSGVDEIWDRDVFTYAGTLVHELRHIELHHSGQAPGGWQEEVLCEEAAYDALKAAQAPGGVMQRYEQYFADPLARRYRHWYDWYDQQD